MPTVRALAADGRPFRGLLYGGLMLTPDRGPMVIEWNCRFGDPETQVVLARMQDDLYPWLAGAARGELPAGAPRWRRRRRRVRRAGRGAATRAAARGRRHHGLPARRRSRRRAGVSRGHAPRTPRGRLVTAGGRVLGVTARGRTFKEARARAYTAVADIHFDGMHYRKDIGMRGAPAPGQQERHVR